MHNVKPLIFSATAIAMFLGLTQNSSAYQQQQVLQQIINPYKFHLSFKPPSSAVPPRRLLSTPQQTIIQTPAQDRFFFVDGLISQPATIVPKLFGDKPFWVPHAFQNLCPFVRGPDIDPVWSAGCAPLPFPQMGAVNPQNMQDMYTRLQALQQAQQAQEEQAQKEADSAPSFWEQYMPAGPTDFGMAQMYGPVQQQDMSEYYYRGAAAAVSEDANTVNARGGGQRGIRVHVQEKQNSALKGMSWLGGDGGGFWG